MPFPQEKKYGNGLGGVIISVKETMKLWKWHTKLKEFDAIKERIEDITEKL